MNRRNCIIRKAVLVIMLFISFTIISGAVTASTAEAAVTPSVREEKVTLYAGYKTYKIQLSNISKNAVVAYRSNKAGIAKVTARGIIEPVKAGAATINATVKQNRKTYHFKLAIIVKEPVVSLTKSTKNLVVNDTYQFKAEAKGINKAIKWSVSDPLAADIDDTGKLTAYTDGKITVYAKAGRTSARCTVSVAPKELSSTEIYEKCNSSTMEVVAKDEYGEAIGTGFYIGDGKLVTNYHVIEGASGITVIDNNKKEHKVDTILGFDAAVDLAVLKLDVDYPVLHIWKGKVNGGEDIYTFGNPLGLTGTMTKGMISTASRVLDNVDYIQIDASISHGNSGGPLVNKFGEVIGVNTMYYEDGQNLNFAINIKELQKIDISKAESVTDYHTKYDEEWFQWFKDNIITEDTTVSQDPQKCQEIQAGYGVKGSITASETGDCYYFKLNEPGWVDGLFMFTSLQDLENAEVHLYKYDDGVLKAQGEDNKEELSKSMSVYLDPGEYLVYITTPSGYSGADIDYIFAMIYD